MPKTRLKGILGENEAARILSEQGLIIIKRNFKGPHGEVDIIGEDGDRLVFVEVKSWNRYGFEDMEYSISARKRSNIIKTSELFIFQNPKYASYLVGYDLFFLSRKREETRYIKNAFEGDGTPL